MNRGIRALVYGRVQGVSFRYYTQLEARRLNLTGWVANRFDGTVEVIAEGPQEALQALIDFLHRGPPAARVERINVTWQETTEAFNKFNIAR